MFHFFRRYQRAIFFVITAIIILSFSFFGTYSAMTSSKGDDPVVFTTSGGRKIHKSEYTAYSLFLSTGSTGDGSQTYNFFNDGFLEKDVLSTCVGSAIFHRWQDSFSPYILKKKAQESRFTLYQHPKAPFLGTEYVWTYFIPALKECFLSYQKETNGDAEQLFKKKAALFALEKQFPGSFVKQLLLVQQQQAANWLEADATLVSRDLSLFGYANASDWFGEEFIQKVVQVLLDGSEMAQKEGLSLSHDEVLHSLYQNVQSSTERFQDLQGKSISDLVQVSLRSLGLDLAAVEKIWRDVLLFRQAFTALPNHLFLSAFPFRKVYENGSHYKKLEQYSLQPCLKAHSMQDIAELYTWQKAVLTQEREEEPFLGAYRSIDDVMCSWPEFVEQRFSLSYRMIGPEQLEPLIRVKDLWYWQVQEGNFKTLAKKFPRLLEEKRDDPQSRMEALEQLPASVRFEVDAFSKKQFLVDHPEWIDEQLKAQEFKTHAFFLRPQGDAKEFVGITDARAFAEMLKKADLGEKNEGLARYTQDGLHFYEIVVIDRSSQWELVPLIQLREDGTLSRVVQKILEAQYPLLRKQNPKNFLDDKGEWKPAQEVKGALLEAYLAPLFQILDEKKPEIEKKYPLLCQWNSLQEARFTLFFLPLVIDNLKKLEEGVHVISPAIQCDEVLSGSKEAIERAQHGLFDFVQTAEKVRYDQLKTQPQFTPFFSETFKGDGLMLFIPRSGLCYFKVVESGQDSYEAELRSTVYSLGDYISESIRRDKMEALLSGMDA